MLSQGSGKDVPLIPKLGELGPEGRRRVATKSAVLLHPCDKIPEFLFI